MRAVRPLATRIFLFYFPPMCLALLAGFVAINTFIKIRIKDGLKDSLHQLEAVLDKTDAEHRQRNVQLVAILTENSGLKAAMGLFREVATNSDEMRQARNTLQAHLQELGRNLDYDLLLIVDSDKRPISAVIEGIQKEISPRDLLDISAESNLTSVHDQLYETTRVPINLGEENLGSLIVGRKFAFGSLADIGQAALADRGTLLLTTFSLPAHELNSRLAAKCPTALDGCELNVEGMNYLTLVLKQHHLGERYRLLSFQPIDPAMQRLTEGFKTTFVIIGLCGVCAVFILSITVSRSVSKPLIQLVRHLRHGERDGELSPEFEANSSTKEVNQLAEEFNRTARTVRDSRHTLETAYLQFLETMAQALDARDNYTAGHSNRVSEFSVALAEAVGLSNSQVEVIRIGAKLHDIGKIGIPDSVLQKAGKLLPEEFDLIKQHPQIGRRILEKVGRFGSYLSIVELHHENHDGSGYPFGLKGDEIPIEARIVHVADVYDAITSDRSYRKAMPIGKVLEILERGAGTQFDPHVVRTFLSLLRDGEVVYEEFLASA